ncbi:MAG: HAD hydrolase family protein [Bacteroidota bacterium]|nr:HAD hydrolase family protein [Bacteroidota bacterium]
MPNFKQKLHKINTFIFDIDGVLTDASVLLMPDGQNLRIMNVKDGYALQLAVKKGYNVAVISGGRCDAVYHRFNYLGIKDVFLGIENKKSFFEKYIAEKGISLENIIYMGDDIPDYEIMTIVGIPTCPADASEEIKMISDYISDKKGGYGCARDIIEQVLKVQNKWFDKDAFHW